jgi:hypothetical protein
MIRMFYPSSQTLCTARLNPSLLTFSFSLLRALVKPLQERHYHVVRFSSRGVGGSTGRPSWTGLTEAQDLQELVQWGMHTYAVQDVLLVVRPNTSLSPRRLSVLTKFSPFPLTHRVTHMAR